EPAKKPYQRALHDSTAVVDFLVSADLKRAPNQPDGDVAEQPAIFCFGAVLPEFLRDRKPRYFSGTCMRQPPQPLTLIAVGYEIDRQRRLSILSRQDHAHGTGDGTATPMDQ